MSAINKCMATNMTDNASQSDPSWDWYQSFLEVLRRGSLSAAARALRLTQPTIGRHIAAPKKRWAAARYSLVRKAAFCPRMSRLR